MALNFGLLDTSLPEKIAGSYYAGQQEQQKNMLARQQVALQQQQMEQANALNRMKMDEYQRGLQEQNALRSSVAADFDINNPAHVNAILRASPTAGAAFLEKYSQGAKERAMAEKERAATTKGHLDNASSMLAGVNDQPGYDAWRSVVVKTMPDLANILPMQFSQEAKNALLTKADDISKKLTAGPTFQTAAPGTTVLKDGLPIYTAAEKPPAPPASVAEFERAQKDPAFMQFLQQRAAATRAPAAPRPEQPPVAVVDPVTGKQVYVTREEALRGRMTPATAMESLPPKEIQKREAAYPQATSSIKGFEKNSDLFIKDLIALRDDSGLNQITGPVYGRTPSLSREGSRAQARYNKIFAKGGFQALQDMRDASKTGGALGNVSNQEGERLERSIVGGLDRTQNIDDVKQGINDLIDQIQGSKARMREAYDDTYSYKSGSAPAQGPATVPGKTNAPATATKPGSNLTAAEQAELEQLRQRFGKK